MVPVIEEYISDLARSIGNIYDNLNNGVGTINTPGSALFEIEQISQMASNNLPQFGIILTNPKSFVVTYDGVNSPYFVSLSEGQVGYKNQRLQISSQSIPIKRAFSGAYDNTYQYGMCLGFPLSEAQAASTVYSTTVTSTTASGATVLPINDIGVANELGFPLQAHVGTAFIVFSGFNAAKTGLVIDPSFYNGSSYGQLSQQVTANTKVYFIYEPRVKAICGFPVVGSNTDPTAFTYYPPTPTDWLPIANVLITNPPNPSVVGITQTATEWPASDPTHPLFDPSDTPTILAACNSAQAQLTQMKNSASTAGLIQSIREYTTAISPTPQTSFRQFWAKQPFRPSSYFGRGISFAGLERIDFPLSFGRAYLSATGDDIQHTFALFRGDLYSATNVIIANETVSNVNASALLSGPIPSSLTRGTYVYGVSAVLSTGETPPTYFGVTANNNNATYFANEITWNVLSGAQFYHIYRKSTIAGDLTEQRLTSANQIIGGGQFTNTPVSVSTNTTISNAYESFKIVPTGSTYLGGIGIQLMASAAITNPSDSIQIKLYTDNGGEPGTLMATGTTIPYGYLNTTNFQVLYSKLDSTVIINQPYWIVLSYTNVAAGGNVRLGIAPSGSNVYATSPDGSTWTTVNSKSPYFELHGYFDNGLSSVFPIQRGIRLTNRVALTPRRLSVYVPPLSVDTLPGEAIPLSAGEGDSNISLIETSEIKNDLVVTVIAQKGPIGTPVKFTITVPQGTVRDTRFLLGTSTQLFDRINDVQVAPGTNLRLGSNGQINWSVYDFITVETVP